MNKLQLSPLIAAIGLTGAMYVNAQTAEDQSNSASPTLTPGTANPMPATHPAEGTAADRTPPGQTPVRGTAASRAPEQATAQGSEQQSQDQQNSQAQQSSDAGQMTPGTTNPIPATRQAEGTAADTTAPGQTPVRGAAASQAPDQATEDEESEDQSQRSPSSAQPMPRTRTAEGPTDTQSDVQSDVPTSGTADTTQSDTGTQRE